VWFPGEKGSVLWQAVMRQASGIRNPVKAIKGRILILEAGLALRRARCEENAVNRIII